MIYDVKRKDLPQQMLSVRLLSPLHNSLQYSSVPLHLGSVEHTEAGLAAELAVIPDEALYTLLLGSAYVV